MKILLWLCCSLLVLTLLGGCKRTTSADAYDSNGRPIYLAAYQGKWLIVNYWATWCQPCYSEMPILARLSRDHAHDLVVIGVNFEQASSLQLKRFAAEHAIPYPLVSQLSTKKLEVPAIEVLPTTLIINPQGKRVATLVGPQTEQQLLAIIKI